MKLSELINETEARRGSLLGLTISGKLVTEQSPNESWTGNFYCSREQLTSLEYAPKSVSGGFFCLHNQLTSLEHAPSSVDGDFSCSDNKLTSLEHAPRPIGGAFYCSGNQLTSLEHAPRTVVRGFSCSYNQLTSLEHAPSNVGGEFTCSYNKLTSLHNVHKQIKQMDGWFNCQGNPITKQILGVLLIKGCTGFIFRDDIDRIMNKYLPNTRGMVAVDECQNELIEAGFEDYAEL